MNDYEYLNDYQGSCWDRRMDYEISLLKDKVAEENEKFKELPLDIQVMELKKQIDQLSNTLERIANIFSKFQDATIDNMHYLDRTNSYQFAELADKVNAHIKQLHPMLIINTKEEENESDIS
jgi:hypothetical protein